MSELGRMPGASMAWMGLTAALCFLVPVGLAVYFRRRGGRWKDFLLGAAVFFLFVLVLEQGVHALVLGGPLGPAITGNLLLYGLYGGLMAGLFEETGRLVAFRFLRPGPGQPQRALMYGAGHGGIEAMLLVGVTYINHLILSAALNSGGAEQLLAGADPATLQAVTALVSTPSVTFLWAGVERLFALVTHLSLSVVVYLAWCRGRQAGLPLFVLAILLHAGVNFCAVVAAAFLPIAAVELLVGVWAAGLALLAWKLSRPETGEIQPME